MPFTNTALLFAFAVCPAKVAALEAKLLSALKKAKDSDADRRAADSSVREARASEAAVIAQLSASDKERKALTGKVKLQASFDDQVRCLSLSLSLFLAVCL